jgi:hypothetical protein
MDLATARKVLKERAKGFPSVITNTNEAIDVLLEATAPKRSSATDLNDLIRNWLESLDDCTFGNAMLTKTEDCDRTEMTVTLYGPGGVPGHGTSSAPIGRFLLTVDGLDEDGN